MTRTYRLEEIDGGREPRLEVSPGTWDYLKSVIPEARSEDRCSYWACYRKRSDHSDWERTVSMAHSFSEPGVGTTPFSFFGIDVFVVEDLPVSWRLVGTYQPLDSPMAIAGMLFGR